MRASDGEIIGARAFRSAPAPWTTWKPPFHTLPAQNVACVSSQPIRSFTTTFQLQKKKGGKADREQKQSENHAPSDDPFDFATLETDIAEAVKRLKTDLSELRPGGRFNPEKLEKLRVQYQTNPNQTLQLSDMAQVIPKGGRKVEIMVLEKAYVKPITSAIQSSNLSLTPQPDPTGENPLLLVIALPGPTAETRKAASDQANEAAHKANMHIREGRGRQQKKLRQMQVGKTARPDDLKKAGQQMEKVVEKGNEEVKRMVESAKKALEGGN